MSWKENSFLSLFFFKYEMEKQKFKDLWQSFINNNHMQEIEIQIQEASYVNM